MENRDKKSLKDFLKKEEKREKKEEKFLIPPVKKEEEIYEGFISPKFPKSKKADKKISSLKEYFKKEEEKIKYFEKKYEFDIKEIENLIYEKRIIIFNFIASYFLYLDLGSVSKITKEMPYGEPFPLEWVFGEAIIGEPIKGEERYEFFIGKNGRIIMQLKGIGDKFEKIVDILKFIISKKELGIRVLENYGKDLILFANSLKKEPSLKYEECLPENIEEEEEKIYRELFFKITQEKEVKEIEEEKEEEKIIYGIKFKPLLKRVFIGNPFNLLYSSFPEIKDIYEEHGEKIHTFVNDLTELLITHNLCFENSTWKEIENNFLYLKEEIIPKILPDVKKKFKEEYERFVSKTKKIKSFIKENLKEKEKILINIIDFMIACYIIIKKENIK
jgi:hypothetical protein